MRMWMVNPKVLCDQHLLGEHLETHMFYGTIKKGISIDGYVEKGLVEVHNIKRRHDELAKEMRRRVMNHKSPMKEENWEKRGKVNTERNLRVLSNRCKQCKRRVEEWKLQSQGQS
jgi:hypothetical protein